MSRTLVDSPETAYRQATEPVLPSRMETPAPDPRVSATIAGLSYALDLAEGRPGGHSVRSCVLGMRLADEIGLSPAAQTDLYYALLLKDAGSGGDGSHAFPAPQGETADWTKMRWDSLESALPEGLSRPSFVSRVRRMAEVGVRQKRSESQRPQVRCERSAAIARRIGFSAETAGGIRSLDEMWDGTGNPDGRRGEQIPLLARIVNLAQSVEIFYTAFGPRAAIEMAKQLNGVWFDPELVRAFRWVTKNPTLWADVEGAQDCVLAMEPPALSTGEPAVQIDSICREFADIIDAKSPFTYRHSTQVAETAASIARVLEISQGEVTQLRRAALLHDIGKLGVPNSILDKPGKLEAKEWECARSHAACSYEILNRIPGFSAVSEMAASHHEKLDGNGYFRGLTAERLSLSARILALSNTYHALSAKRPYRDALPPEPVLEFMRKNATGIDAACLEALEYSRPGAGLTTELMQLSENLQNPLAAQEAAVSVRST